MGTATKNRPLAVITGASRGIGFALARECVDHGFDLVICADSEDVERAAEVLSQNGASVEPVIADLGTFDGVEDLWHVVERVGRPIDALILNAGVGVGGSFLDTDLDDELDMIDLNVSSLVHLAKRLLPGMVARGEGRVLITASVAATTPTPFAAVYGATKAFDLSFAEALRSELAEHGITVTALQPGATDTNFFNRAHMTDTKVGASKKDDPADVAREGFAAMMAGKDSVVAGSIKSKVQGYANEILPETTKARLAYRQHKPGSARKM